MPLRTSQPPQASRDALQSQFPAGGAAPQAPPSEHAAVEPFVRDDGLPHRVYFIGLQDLAEGKSLSAAEQISWRYLLGHGDYAEVAAEISHDGNAATEHRFHSLNRGPFVQGTLDALTAVENDTRLIAGEFELQVLRIPALYVMALWFKSLNGTDDLLVPMPPVYDPLTPLQIYTESEFLETLRGPAQEVLASSDPLPEGN